MTVPPHQRAHLKVLGEGRCSLVLSLTPFHLWAHFFIGTEVAAFNGHESVALRIHKLPRASVMEPTVERRLSRYLGTSVWITPSPDLIDALCAEWDTLVDAERHKLRPETVGDDQFFETYVQNAESLMLLQDFTAPIGGRNEDVVGQRDLSLKSSATFEVKPKSSWQEPLFRAARFYGPLETENGVNAGEELRQLHPRKLSQCRFSQMQVWKEARKGKKRQQQETDAVHAPQRYCPNDLLMEPTAVAKESALIALSLHPENNLKCIDIHESVAPVQASSKEVECINTAACLSAASVALAHFDICARITSLQLGGSLNVQQDTLLDVELLHHWLRCQREGGTDFQVLRRLSVAPRNEEQCSRCACKEGPLEIVASPLEVDPTREEWIRPPFSLNEALDSFYVSTTAKDLSLIITVERWSSVDDGGGAATPVPSLVSNTLPQITMISSQAIAYQPSPSELIKCRVGVVDIDCKRHKSVDHYFHQDADICAVVDSVMKSKTQ